MGASRQIQGFLRYDVWPIVPLISQCKDMFGKNTKLYMCIIEWSLGNNGLITNYLSLSNHVKLIHQNHLMISNYTSSALVYLLCNYQALVSDDEPLTKTDVFHKPGMCIQVYPVGHSSAIELGCLDRGWSCEGRYVMRTNLSHGNRFVVYTSYFIRCTGDLHTHTHTDTHIYIYARFIRHSWQSNHMIKTVKAKTHHKYILKCHRK